MMLGTYEEDHAVRIQRYKEGMELATMNLGKDFFLRKVDDFTLLSRQNLYFILSSLMRAHFMKLAVCAKLNNSSRKF